MARYTITACKRAGVKPPSSAYQSIQVTITGTGKKSADVRLYQIESGTTSPVGLNEDPSNYYEEGKVSGDGVWNINIMLGNGQNFALYASDYDDDVASRSSAVMLQWAALIK